MEIDTDVKDVWNLTSLEIPHGKKLVVYGSKPLVLRVQGAEPEEHPESAAAR